MNNEMISLKPHKVAFFFPKIITPIIIISIMIIVSLISQILPLIIGISIVAFVILIIIWWIISIQYNKTSYLLTIDKIIYNTGSLFYDQQTELPIKNITHLKLQLPFISYLLFKTGNIKVESAGSDATEGKLIALASSEDVYQKLQSLMKNNGFSLQKNELKEEMKPSQLAVVLDTLNFIGGGAFLTVYVFFGVLFDEETNSIDESFRLIAIIIVGIIFVGVLIFAIFRYLDLSKRLYRVYNDTITYKEGFLTKNHSLIPFENLADSLATQGIVDRLFGLYDVALSCQGAGREIKFKNIINGKELSASVRNLINKFKDTKQQIVEPNKKHPERTQDKTNFDTNFTAVFRMNKLRALFFPIFGLILTIILAVFVHEVIGATIILGWISVNSIISVFSTTYSVKAESMQYYYKFIKTKEIEFVNDKITSIIFTESLIDKLFGTCQIAFGSIGSANKMDFNHIKKQSGLYPMFLNKVGIQATEIEHQLLPNFGFFALMKSNLILPIIILSFITVSIVATIIEPKITIIIAGVSGLLLVIFLPIYIYLVFYYKKSGIYFLTNCIHVAKGIIIQTKAYAAYNNIKDIETVKYPLTKIGNLYFNVAGESVVNQEMDGKKVAKYVFLGYNAAKIRKTSHGLTLAFIDDIPLQNDILDHILQSPLKKDEINNLSENLMQNPIKPVLIEKPDIANTLLFPNIIAVLMVLVIILMQIPTIAIIGVAIIWLLIAGLITWSIKAISFQIQSFRIVKKSGIFYRKQTSILFAKIDHINKSQDFTNKIFKNGNVAIHTIGSSKLEINVHNLEHYQEFYEKMKQEIL